MDSKFMFLESMDILSAIPQHRTLLGSFLVFWLLWFTVRKHFNRNKNIIPSNEEVERKLDEWWPESLIPESNKNHPSLNPKSVSSRVGKWITIDGQKCLNLATHNYLGLTENKEIEDRAIATIQKYGVGSCGPRGFYGTSDIHLELEERLAKYTETEEAVVYSYGFSTIASAIPAYCKRKDIIFVDEKVNFAVQKGLDASKAKIQYFKHNSVIDLNNLLEKQAKIDEKNPKKAMNIRRFLIVEGIYMNTGKICPLPDLIPLCRKYKLRIFIDESISFGTLGTHGRGVTEYYNVPRDEIDMIMASLDWAIGSIGGFCVGTSFIIDHQRLSGLGYCFSASSPPSLSAAAIASLEVMEKNPDLFKILKHNCTKIHNDLKQIVEFEVPSFPESPVQHLYLKKQLDMEAEKEILLTISTKCMKNGVGIILPAYLDVEKYSPRPSLRLCVSTLLTSEDIDNALDVLKRCVKDTLS